MGRARIRDGLIASHQEAVARGAEDCLGLMDRVVLGFGEETGPRSVPSWHDINCNPLRIPVVVDPNIPPNAIYLVSYGDDDDNQAK